MLLLGRSWIGRVFSAFLDQALFASGNFLVTVLLARWLSTREFGAFVVAYAWFILWQNIHDSLLLESMAVFGPAKYKKHFRRYLGTLYWGHCIVSFLAAITLVCGGVLYDGKLSPELDGALIGAGLAAPLLLLRWLTRQPLYVIGGINLSSIASLIYFLLAVVLLLALRDYDLSTAGAAFGALALAGLVSSLFITLVRLRPRLFDTPRHEIRAIVADHAGYGRWAVLYRLLAWIPMNLIYIALPWFYSLEETAQLRALMNLAMPAFMAFTTLSTLMLPEFVRAYEDRGQAAIRSRVFAVSGLVGGGSILYAVVLVIFGNGIMPLLYGQAYGDVAEPSLLVALALTVLIGGIAVGPDTGLKATGRVKFATLARVVPAVLTFVIGLPLIALFDILGALILINILGVLRIGTLLWFMSRSVAAPQSEAGRDRRTMEAQGAAGA